MTVDVNFSGSDESFNKSFEFPVDATVDEIKLKVATWLEEKDASTVPDGEIDLAGVVTGRVERKEYELAKAELAELNELVVLGAIDVNDQKVKGKQAEVKLKYKDGYKKEK